MSTERRTPDLSEQQVNRLLRSFLREEWHEDANRVASMVLDELDATPQRRTFWSAWRSFPVNNTIRVGLAAAAVVVIALIGYQVLSGSNVAGPRPADSPQPTSAPPSAVVDVPFLPDGLLEPGTYSIRAQDVDAPRVIVTVPAGWHGGGFGVSKNNSIDPPDGAGVIIWGGPFDVYEDPCQWAGAEIPRVGQTVDDLVADLAAQPTRDATAATDITVDGYAGKAMELTVPADLAFNPGDGSFPDCDEGEFRSWISPDRGSYRVHQGPGQHDQLWIVVVDGTRIIIDATFYEGTSETDRAEIEAILASIRFE